MINSNCTNYNGGAFFSVIFDLSVTFVMLVRTLFPSRSVSQLEHVPCLHWNDNRIPALDAANDNGEPNV